MADSINKNTISEILARKNLNALNELKNTEIKNKSLISKQKELLNLFSNLLDAISTENKNNNNNSTNNNNSKNNNTNNNNTNNSNNSSSSTTTINNNNNNNNNNENGSESENENENESENENENQIKELNDSVDKIIDESKSFEEQIKLFKKVKDLNQYWRCNTCDDKKLKFKIFKQNLANCSSFIDEELFAKIFSYPLLTLANKLINTTSKEENEMIIANIQKNEKILYEADSFNNWMIQPNAKRVDLIDAIKLILNFNETKMDKVNAY